MRITDWKYYEIATLDQKLADARASLEFDISRVGMPGSITRLRAQFVLDCLNGYATLVHGEPLVLPDEDEATLPRRPSIALLQASALDLPPKGEP